MIEDAPAIVGAVVSTYRDRGLRVTWTDGAPIATVWSPDIPKFGVEFRVDKYAHVRPIGSSARGCVRRTKCASSLKMAISGVARSRARGFSRFDRVSAWDELAWRTSEAWVPDTDLRAAWRQLFGGTPVHIQHHTARSHDGSVQIYLNRGVYHLTYMVSDGVWVSADASDPLDARLRLSDKARRVADDALSAARRLGATND